MCFNNNIICSKERTGCLCADPESFVKGGGGGIQKTFFEEGRGDLNATKSGPSSNLAW